MVSLGISCGRLTLDHWHSSIQRRAHKAGPWKQRSFGWSLRHVANGHNDRKPGLSSEVMGTSWAHPGHRQLTGEDGDLCPACVLRHAIALLTHFRLATKHQCEWLLTGKALIGAAGGGQTWRRSHSFYSVLRSLLHVQPLTQPL